MTWQQIHNPLGSHVRLDGPGRSPGGSTPPEEILVARREPDGTLRYAGGARSASVPGLGLFRRRDTAALGRV